MNGFLYCVEDSVSHTFMPPFFSHNDDVAKRDFILGAYQSMTPIQDLNLWKVGKVTFTDGQAVIDGQRNELCNPSLGEVDSYTKIFESMSEKFGDSDE